MAKGYEEQLKDQRWYYVRDRVLERDKWECQSCRSIHNLHVHHKRYEKGRMAWEYNDDDLVTLCGKCHEKVHKSWGTIKVDPFKEKLDLLVTVARAYKLFVKEKFRDG